MADVPAAPEPRPYAVLSAVMFGSVLGPIDASIVNVILPTISRAFPASLAMVQGVPIAYLVAVAGLSLFFGRLGDLVGTRRVFLSGLLFFVAASCLCGAAPSLGWLVVFRAVQGAAAAMMTSVPLAILTRIFPPAERGKAIGLFAISISVGLAIGPSLGGALTAAFGWRAAFFVNLPVGLAAFLFARPILPAAKGSPGAMDLPGAATAAGALSCFVLFVNRVQEVGPRPLPLALLFGALLLAALFVAVERRAAQPLVPLALFRSAPLSSAAAASLLNFMAQYVVVFTTPFLLQRLLHEGPARVGLVMTAFPISVLCVAPFAGALSDRIGTVLPASLGAALCTAACLLLFAGPAEPRAVALGLALFGLGTGAFQSPNNSAAMGSAPREHLGVVSSLLGTTRTLGMVLGVAAAGAVLYAFVPAAALRAPVLAPGLEGPFLLGVRRAYAAGALFAAASGALSLLRQGRAARAS